jgi:hypothetical protein
LSPFGNNWSSILEKLQRYKKENENHVSSHLPDTTNINILEYFLSTMEEKLP